MDNEFNEAAVDYINSALPDGNKIPKEGAQLVGSILERNKEPLKINKESLATARSFLERAQKDLQASKSSYIAEDYAHAVQMLHQATEKAVKGMAIGIFFMDRGKVSNISHKSPKAFIEYTKSEELQPYITLFKQANPKLNADTSVVENTIRTKQEVLANFSAGEINALLLTCANVDLEISKTYPLIEGFIENVKEQAAELGQTKLVKRLEILPEIIKSEIIADMIALYIISMITFPHASYSEYPYSKDGSNLNWKSYTLELGIVEKTPSVWPILEKIIESSNKLLTKYEEIANEEEKI